MVDIYEEHLDISFRAKKHYEQVNYAYKKTFSLHDVALTFHASSEQLIDELTKEFPQNWISNDETGAIHIYWNSPHELVGHQPLNWGELSKADCIFTQLHGSQWVIQRDFMSFQPRPGTYFVVAENTIDDGFHNFLRYLLPRLLLKNNKILFHSSCVVDLETNKAILFFGPSGAGKTTISQLCSEGLVLGDDMNLLYTVAGEPKVEVSALGQRYYAPEYFNQPFNIGACFWLQQDESIRIKQLHNSAITKIFSSLTGLFWDQLSEEEINRSFQISRQLEKKLPIYQLNFNKTKEVWSHVRNFTQSLST